MVRPLGVVWDLGNVLIDWDPVAAVAAGVGPAEARRFLDAPDFDFRAWNHGPDSGGSWDDAEDLVRRRHPHWLDHARAYRANFAASLVGTVPGSVELVRELHAAGIPMWGLTNWSAELYPHAPATFDFLALLEEVVVSGAEGVAKPDARIYEIVGERSGLPSTGCSSSTTESTTSRRHAGRGWTDSSSSTPSVPGTTCATAGYPSEVRVSASTGITRLVFSW